MWYKVYFKDTAESLRATFFLGSSDTEANLSKTRSRHNQKMRLTDLISEEKEAIIVPLMICACTTPLKTTLKSA